MKRINFNEPNMILCPSCNEEILWNCFFDKKGAAPEKHRTVCIDRWNKLKQSAPRRFTRYEIVSGMLVLMKEPLIKYLFRKFVMGGK